MFETKIVEKIQSHNFRSVTFYFFENLTVNEKIWKNAVEPDRPHVTFMTHAHCMLDTQGYKYTFLICNDHCLSTAAMVARRRPTVTLHVHCPS
jgi:hypothetical protein